MAESAVTFLLRKLGSLVEQELKLLGGVKREFLFIRDELESMRAFPMVADAIEDTDLEMKSKAESTILHKDIRGTITNSVAQSKAQAPMWKTIEDVMIEEVMHFY
ncbi:hypothetical protein ACSBR2_037343 [Camellia fascicularis]